jgi:twinkle protein|tara:strand:+ start:220 stop:1974 length:1755 start_codon:yes stop_codon:yes gene_type:complete
MSADTLVTSGIQLKNPTVGNHKTYCPECKNTRKSSNKRDTPLSVTIDNDGGAVWNCHNCGWTGGIASNGYKLDKAIKPKTYKPIVRDLGELSKEAVDWFKDRAIDRSTLDDFKIFKTSRVFNNGSSEGAVAFPYIENGQIVNIKYRSRDKVFRQEQGAKRSLYNIDSVVGDEIIFVEGEMDVLSCWQAGIKNVVTLPDGAPKEASFRPDDKRFTALSDCEKLEKMKKIYIAVDSDGAGQALALELAHRFGKDRCWKVEWPLSVEGAQQKDANECLVEYGAEILKSRFGKATPYPVDGLYKAKDYFSQVWDLYHGHEAKPFSTGFSMLDDIYKLMPATFHVVTGIPNHGKSNFLDQIMVNAARLHGWKFAVFSPEHSTAYHIRRLAEIYKEKPFDMGPATRMSETELREAVDFVEDHFVFIESRETVPTASWILEKSRAACVRHGVKGIVIDPYNEISAARSNGKREDEHIRDMISSFKQFCRKHNTIMWVVAHPAKLARQNDGSYPVPSMYDISGSAHWHNMADVGLVVHRYFDEGTVAVVTKKIREQGLYGNIGECMFKYNVEKKSYKQIEPEIQRNYYNKDD